MFRRITGCRRITHLRRATRREAKRASWNPQWQTSRVRTVPSPRVGDAAGSENPSYVSNRPREALRKRTGGVLLRASRRVRLHNGRSLCLASSGQGFLSRWSLSHRVHRPKPHPEQRRAGSFLHTARWRRRHSQRNGPSRRIHREWTSSRRSSGGGEDGCPVFASRSRIRTPAFWWQIHPSRFSLFR